MGMSLMSLLIALLFYDLSKRMGIAIIALTGVVRVNSLFTLWGGNVAELLGALGLAPTTQNIAITVAVVMLVLASTLMLLSEKDLASRWASGFWRPIISPRRACGPRLSPSAATRCRPPVI